MLLPLLYLIPHGFKLTKVQYSTDPEVAEKTYIDHIVDVAVISYPLHCVLIYFNGALYIVLLQATAGVAWHVPVNQRRLYSDYPTCFKRPSSDVCTTTTQRVPNVMDVWNTLGSRCTCTNVAVSLGLC